MCKPSHIISQYFLSPDLTFAEGGHVAPTAAGTIIVVDLKYPRHLPWQIR